MGKLKWSVACIAALALAPAHGRNPSTTEFGCSAGLSFEVEYRDRGRVAAVRTAAREFVLSRKPGSLGERFSSGDATLIIDGDFAAFVSNEESNYSQCKAANRIVPTSSRSNVGRRG